jgi:hypothetical protein
MSKYTEYREIAEKMDTVVEERIFMGDGKTVRIEFNPVKDDLRIIVPEYYDYSEYRATIDGRVGEALFKALKQFYE